MSKHVLTWVLASTFTGAAAQAVEIGLTDDFSLPGLSGWQNTNTAGALDNPLTGGVGGATDGFLEITDSGLRLGARNSESRYTGNWVAAGIQEIELFLSDVGTDDDLEVHVLISNDTSLIATTWMHTPGFNPPDGTWAAFTADLTDESQWTRIRGTASFQSVLQNVRRFHLRHDLAPYQAEPDGIDGDLGVDNISLKIPEPAAATTLALTAALAIGTRRSTRPPQHNTTNKRP